MGTMTGQKMGKHNLNAENFCLSEDDRRAREI